MSDVAFDFTGENFVVVGASSGMGRQISLDLAKSGAHVLAIARNEERLQELKRQALDQIEVAILDVLSATVSEWQGVVQTFVEHCGLLSGGVYTAGIIAPTPLRMFDRKLAHDIMATSLWGMTDFMQTVTKKQVARQGASYVVIASAGAYTGQKGYWTYSASKSAVQTAVKSMAKEIVRNRHRINSISPGSVKTEMTQQAMDEMGYSESILQRHHLGLGTARDVSSMALFLLSDAASWITGTDVVVDGGYLLGCE